MASKKPEQKPWTKFEKVSYVLIVVVSIIFFPVGVVIVKDILGIFIVSAIYYPLLLFIYIPIIYIACRKKLRNKTKKTFLNLFKKSTLKQFNTDVFNRKSNADELKKYADLKDQGIITEEEFQAKKKKLLDF
ncbi:MAG: SHOCT domain-containing protein [Prochlorococcus marinus CUG1438]|nr:SHOCT domain-containing protein [Prochlorococcus marinus CUG1438]